MGAATQTDAGHGTCTIVSSYHNVTIHTSTAGPGLTYIVSSMWPVYLAALNNNPVKTADPPELSILPQCPPHYHTHNQLPRAGQGWTGGTSGHGTETMAITI